MWSFETDPELQEQLDWTDQFVRDEIELLDYVVRDERNLDDPVRQRLIPPLQEVVKERGLWAGHLPRSLGGAELTHVELSLLNEILGRTRCGPTVFGCQSPDCGNMELLAQFGSDHQRREFLEPLAAGKIVSAFSATEPQGGADPTRYETTAVLDDDEWVLDGEKWFVSGADYAAFHIVMARTDPDADPHARMSLFIVPRTAAGVAIKRNVHVHGDAEHEHHSYVEYTRVRIPARNLIGSRGAAFAIMQARMTVARMALAMRALGAVRRSLEMACERAVSRTTKGEPLADKQLVQAMIADSWLDVEQLRLLVLQTAWKLERADDPRTVRGDVAAVKARLPQVVQEVATRSIQIHGALGLSDEMPFVRLLTDGLIYAVADGPTEVHKVTLARELLKRATPAPGAFPSRHGPALRAAAERRYAEALRSARVGAA